VAARLAGLVRNRAAGAQLVPVRNLGGSAGPARQPAPPAPATAPTGNAASNNAATLEES
jgi:hypothetical protein